MPRRNFREIDSNSSDRHFGTGDRFMAEVNRSGCLGVSGVDLLPAERPALDQQCPSPVKGRVLFPVNTNGVGLLNGPEWRFCTISVIWQGARFLKPETICKFGGRIQPDGGRGKEKRKRGQDFWSMKP